MRSREYPTRCNQGATTLVSAMECHPSLPWPAVLDSSLTIDHTAWRSIMSYAAVLICEWVICQDRITPQHTSLVMVALKMTRGHEKWHKTGFLYLEQLVCLSTAWASRSAAWVQLLAASVWRLAAWALQSVVSVWWWVAWDIAYSSSGNFSVCTYWYDNNHI